MGDYSPSKIQFKYNIGDIVVDTSRNIIDFVEIISYTHDMPYYKLRNLGLYQYETYLKPATKLHHLLYGRNPDEFITKIKTTSEKTRENERNNELLCRQHQPMERT